MLRARALPITLWPVVQGTAPSCPVPLWSGDTRVSAVSGKNFPRGRFLTTSAGSPAGWPGPWAQRSPGLSIAWCRLSSGVFSRGPDQPHGSSGRGCSGAWGCPWGMLCLGKQKGPAAPSTRDWAAEE